MLAHRAKQDEGAEHLDDLRLGIEVGGPAFSALLSRLAVWQGLQHRPWVWQEPRKRSELRLVAAGLP